MSEYLPPPDPTPRQPRRTTLSFDNYIAYTPPTDDSVQDAELGIDIPYNDTWPEQIFLWLSAGKSLLTWCEQEGKPARSRVLQWFQDLSPEYDLLRERFERGMVNRALALLDESTDVADEPLIANQKGFFDPISAMDKKQRFDAKLRVAALLDPVKFSPTSKVAQSVALTQINITNKNLETLSDAQLTQVVLEMERKKNGRATSTGATSGTGSQRTPDSPVSP